MNFRSIALAAVFALALPTLASAGARQDFTLINSTGDTIDQVYVSPSNEESWMDDVLGRDVLEDGVEVNIHFDRNTSSCKWDLKVVYTDGEDAIWEDIDLCSVSTVDIYWDRSRGVTRAEVR